MDTLSTNFSAVREQENLRAIAGLVAHPVGSTMIHSQVMSEDQMTTLRKQISAYTSITKQLIAMHKIILIQQNPFNGLTPGQALTFNSMMGFAGHKMTTRQRWTPSQVQLQILENIFDRGKGTPCKQRIKEITAQLSQHGHISETNVYNWFQNRRARTKRKQQIGQITSGEYEMDNLPDSSKEKKTKYGESSGQETSVTRQSSATFQNHEGVSEHCIADSQQHRSSTSLSSQVVSKAASDFNRSASFEQDFSATRNVQLVETGNSLHAGEGPVIIGHFLNERNSPATVANSEESTFANTFHVWNDNAKNLSCWRFSNNIFGHSLNERNSPSSVVKSVETMVFIAFHVYNDDAKYLSH
ncbi:hypothetical protein KI387_032499 [Taxus chinensis]|uniref:Homeobox domain-containing protein n=1 Tax=Taxus chinensis TaxID=29808 RepID=A0AA38C1W7_TAXCH|nr:hypothetical protein KI387_032499 [Taxus chinensis]